MWILVGAGRLERSSRRTLESVWGARLAGSMLVDGLVGCSPV